jgi:hypothetical protein
MQNLFLFCSMLSPTRKQEAFTSCQGIGQRPLSDFPEAWIAVSCCGREDVIHVEKLLKDKDKRTVATVIDGIQCGRCGQPPQTAYLQRYPYREDSVYSTAEMPGWSCVITPSIKARD